MASPIRIVQYGLGPIGLAVSRALFRKEASGEVQLTGAIDIDPQKVGRDLGDLAGVGRKGVLVTDDPRKALADANVVVHTTSSFLDQVYDQLALCAEAGVHVVSSTEELSYPHERNPELAGKLDDLCRSRGVAVLGTGVNPGYAMDALAVMATGVCVGVTKINIERIVDASRRRGPLQRKIGAGLSPEEFAEKKATGRFGHIGLRESMLLIADALGWQPSQVTETLDPVIADKEITTDVAQVRPGEVAGIHQTVVAYNGTSPIINLDLIMSVAADSSVDRINVEGDPPIQLEIRNGIFGDTATVATLVNAIPLLSSLEPGLRKVTDAPVPRALAPSY